MDTIITIILVIVTFAAYPYLRDIIYRKSKK
jgi:hypothetical protein